MIKIKSNKNKRHKFYRFSDNLYNYKKMKLDWKEFSYKLFVKSWEEIFIEDKLK